MDFTTVLKEYGPWVAIAIYSVFWFADKGWPQVMKIWSKNQDSNIKAEDDKRKTEAEEREAKLKADAAEREWQHRMEERHMAAMEAVGRALPEMAILMAGMQADIRKLRDDTTILVERKATVTTTTIPQ